MLNVNCCFPDIYIYLWCCIVEMKDDGSSSTQEVEGSLELNIPGNEMLEVKLAHFPDPFYSFKHGGDDEE